MIYITGDTHIPIDIHKLSMTNFREQKEMTKQDYVIICGDFGGIWNNSNEDKYWLDWLKDKNFTTLFVDGNHENFNLLNEYPVTEWGGGKVHFINDSVIHLMRGQVYTINKLKFFTMGGATSIDKENRVENKSWWKEELPSDLEFIEAIKNLDKHCWKVDYVISHTTSNRIVDYMGYRKEDNDLNSFFSMLEKELEYKHWYFGHFHRNWEIDNKNTVLYNRIVKLENK